MTRICCNLATNEFSNYEGRVGRALKTLHPTLAEGKPFQSLGRRLTSCTRDRRSALAGYRMAVRNLTRAPVQIKAALTRSGGFP